MATRDNKRFARTGVSALVGAGVGAGLGAAASDDKAILGLSTAGGAVTAAILSELINKQIQKKQPTMLGRTAKAGAALTVGGAVGAATAAGADQGKTYINKKLGDYFTKKNINPVVAGTPAANAVEQSNNSLLAAFEKAKESFGLKNEVYNRKRSKIVQKAAAPGGRITSIKRPTPPVAPTLQKVYSSNLEYLLDDLRNKLAKGQASPKAEFAKSVGRAPVVALDYLSGMGKTHGVFGGAKTGPVSKVIGGAVRRPGIALGVGGGVLATLLAHKLTRKKQS